MYKEVKSINSDRIKMLLDNWTDGQTFVETDTEWDIVLTALRLLYKQNTKKGNVIFSRRIRIRERFMKAMYMSPKLTHIVIETDTLLTWLDRVGLLRDEIETDFYNKI